MPDQPTFRSFDPARDREALISLLTSEEWTYRAQPIISEAAASEELEQGTYAGEGVITLMIELDGEVVGLVRAFRLAAERENPELDFRLRESARGHGIGLAALRHMTELVFSRHPDKRRIEGETRADNIAMRKVFERGGYAQEAVYRSAWPGTGGEYFDGIGYAILRADWESGTITPVRWEAPS